MFNAYPHQGRLWRPWKLLLPLLAFGPVSLLVYSVLETSGKSSRPGRSGELTGLHFREPFIASSSFEVGIWTRQRGSGGASGGSQPGSQDHVGPAEVPVLPPRPATSTQPPLAKTSAPSDPEVQSLRAQLEAERARSAAQEAELARLRGGATMDAPAEALPPPAVVQTPAPVVAAPAPPPAEAEAAQIPDSLWRQPPGDDDGPHGPSKMGASQATTTTATTMAAGSAAAPPQGLPQGEHQITVKKTGDREILVQISHADREGPPPKASAAELPATPERAAGPPQAAERPQPGREPPDSQLTETTTSAPATGSAPAAPSPSPTPSPLSEGTENRITVKADGSEIIVQFGDSQGRGEKGEQATQAQAPAPAQATTEAPVRTSTTMPDAALEQGHAEPQRVTTSNAGPAASVPASTSTLTSSAELPDQKPEVSKESQGTKILVKSQGQSITIEVGGRSAESGAAEAPVASVNPPPAPTSRDAPSSTLPGPPILTALPTLTSAQPAPEAAPEAARPAMPPAAPPTLQTTTLAAHPASLRGAEPAGEQPQPSLPLPASKADPVLDGPTAVASPATKAAQASQQPAQDQAGSKGGPPAAEAAQASQLSAQEKAGSKGSAGADYANLAMRAR